MTWEVRALIDTGCTKFLISQVVAAKLGVQVRELPKPMRFKQGDGFLLGAVPDTHVTELVRLELGQHWEVIQFTIVLTTMTESVIWDWPGWISEPTQYGGKVGIGI